MLKVLYVSEKRNIYFWGTDPSSPSFSYQNGRVAQQVRAQDS